MRRETMGEAAARPEKTNMTRDLPCHWTLPVKAFGLEHPRCCQRRAVCICEYQTRVGSPPFPEWEPTSHAILQHAWTAESRWRGRQQFVQTLERGHDIVPQRSLFQHFPLTMIKGGLQC